MTSQVSETSTPSKKRKLGDVQSQAANSQIATFLLEDLESTQSALENADNDQALFYPTDLPEMTIRDLVHTVLTMSDNVKDLKTTMTSEIDSLKKQIVSLKKQSKGLKKVIKTLYTTSTNTPKGMDTGSVPNSAATETSTQNASLNPTLQAPPAADSMEQRTIQPVRKKNPRQSVQTQSEKDAIWALKTKVVPKWGKKYFYRTKEWGRGYENNYRAHTLHTHSTSTPPYIPPKFRKHHATNKEHFRILEKRSQSEMTSTAEEYRHNASVAKANAEKTDGEVIQQINRHKTRSERLQLLALWEQECDAGQEHCIRRFRKQAEWLTALPTNKPYLGFTGRQQNNLRNNPPTNNLINSRNVTNYYTEDSGANDGRGGFQRYQRGRRNQSRGISGRGGRPSGRQVQTNFW